MKTTKSHTKFRASSRGPYRPGNLFRENQFKEIQKHLNFLPENHNSVPLRGTLEMDFDGLFGVGDVEPSAVGFPSFRKHLNEHAAERRVGNVRHAFPIGFHIQFHGLIFFDLMLFDVFEVHAGVFNGCFLIAARDFDGDARLWIGFGLARLRFRS